MIESQASGVGEETHEVSVLRLINMLLRHRAWVISLPILAVLLTAVYTIMQPRTYTSGGSFIPIATDQSGSGVSGLAAQFGITVSANAERSPQFYADLMTSPAILNRVMDSSFSVNGGPSRSLAQILGISANSPGELRLATIEQLKQIVNTSVDAKTGVIRYSITTMWPDLSLQLANQVLGSLDAFLMQSRRDRAAADRSFFQDRVAVTLAELRAAEGKLQDFLDRNRLYQGDPKLIFEHDRLEREVRIREMVYTTLVQSLEQASVESSRSTAAVARVQTPELAARPNSRLLVVHAFLAAIAGVLLGAFVAAALEFAHYSRKQQSTDYEAFRELSSRVATDFRHPFRALRNAMPRRPQPPPS